MTQQSVEREATQPIEFPNDEIGEVIHVVLVKKQKPMNEQPNEIYWMQ